MIIISGGFYFSRLVSVVRILRSVDAFFRSLEGLLVHWSVPSFLVSILYHTFLVFARRNFVQSLYFVFVQ